MEKSGGKMEKNSERVNEIIGRRIQENMENPEKDENKQFR